MPNGKPHYKVHTFEGPLDLLLQLIEEKKLPINQIALAEVTEQFLQHLKAMEHVSPEILVDFLNIAGKLLIIKSRSLLPSLEVEAEEDETDLTKQLLLLKKYREASKHIKTYDSRRKQSFSREPFTGLKAFFFPDPEVTLTIVEAAARKVTASLAEVAKLPQRHVAEVISISEKIDSLQRTLSEKIQVGLNDLIKSAKSKTEVIVTFLALLELIKQRILTVEQEQLFAEIMIKKNEEQ